VEPGKDRPDDVLADGEHQGDVVRFGVLGVAGHDGWKGAVGFEG
jgi:hypothetical protein